LKIIKQRWVVTLREDWNRTTPVVDLKLSEMTALIQPAFPAHTVVKSELTEGGLANTNIRVWLSPGERPLLLRLYVRSPGDGRKEFALNRLVAGRVPVPYFFYFSPDNPITGHPYALMEWVEGTRLEVAVQTMRPAEIASVGQSVGAVLAAIHCFTFPQTGFLDDNLAVSQPVSVGSDGLIGFLKICLLDGRGGERLGPELTQALFAFAEREGPLLDSWSGPPCLVHSDFGGSNILVQPTSAGWQVAAVLDWEFAFSGFPFFDFGNLLRPSLANRPGFEQGVYEGYTAADGLLPAEWRQMSRLADLLAWADFLNRPNTNAALIRDAKAIITKTIAFHG
jgi:aminoglycoside phosphotransferase (APT) family kinase protein